MTRYGSSVFGYVPDILIFAGSLGGLLFVALYAYLSRHTWHKTETGWHLMTMSADLAFLFTILSINRIWPASHWGYVAIGGTAVLVLTIFWRVEILIKLYYRARRERLDAERREHRSEPDHAGPSR